MRVEPGRVLIVDDNRMNRMKLSHSLVQQGHATADTRLSVIPVIVVSAVEDPQSTEKFKQLGARGYLTKPVDPDELAARVEECLGGAR